MDDWLASGRAAADSTTLLGASLLSAASGFLIALVASWLIRPLALRLGHVDRPGPRKRHLRPVPLGGGVAIFAAIAFPTAVAVLAARGSRPLVSGLFDRFDLGVLARDLVTDAPTLAAFLAGSLLIHVVGLWDDQTTLSAGAKLAAQFAAAAPLVTVCGVVALPQWLDPVSSSILGAVWIVSITNAFNFLDGTDGLAATVGALCATMFAASALLSDQAAEAFLFSLLVGALLGFLVFNFPPATLFMGDGGSQVVGFTLGFCSLQLTYFDAGGQAGSPWYAVFTPLVVLAIPLYDMASVVGLRLLQRRSLFLGDEQHFLHRLSRRGIGARGILALVGGCTVASGIGGVMLSQLAAWQAVLVVIQSLAVIGVLALMEVHLAGATRASSEAREGSGSDADAPRARMRRGSAS